MAGRVGDGLQGDQSGGACGGGVAGAASVRQNSLGDIRGRVVLARVNDVVDGIKAGGRDVSLGRVGVLLDDGSLVVVGVVIGAYVRKTVMSVASSSGTQTCSLLLSSTLASRAC